jgi:hypothetical protein
MRIRDLPRHWRAGVLLAALVLAFAGCTTSGDSSSSSSTTGDGTGGTGDEVKVLAVSGEPVSVQGDWFQCYTSGDDSLDRKEVQTFDGLTFNYKLLKYSTGDASCSADEAADPSDEPIVDADVEVGDDITLAAWAASDDATGGAPAAQDGTTIIADQPMGTPLTFTLDGEDLGVVVRLVDDTADDRIMYRDNSLPENPCAKVDGVPQCLMSEDSLIYLPPE